MEWVALVLCVAAALGAVVAFVPLVDGRSLGGTVVHAIVCAVRGGCATADGDRALAAAYGWRDAALVRRYAPNLVYEPGTYTLPVDWRRCRSHLCSDASDSSNLDAHLSTWRKNKAQFHLIFGRRLFQGVLFSQFGRTSGVNLECLNLRGVQ